MRSAGFFCRARASVKNRQLTVSVEPFCNHKPHRYSFTSLTKVDYIQGDDYVGGTKWRLHMNSHATTDTRLIMAHLHRGKILRFE